MNPLSTALKLPLVLALVALAVAPTNAEVGGASPSAFAVFGYLPEYRLGNFNYSAAFSTGLTHLIFFSLEIDPTSTVPSALDRLPSLEDARRARMAADQVGGKLLVGFGGHSRSRGFAPMVKSPASRGRFLKALDDLLTQYQFDGVDYNWEYPTTAAEWELWRELMKETKQLRRKARSDEYQKDSTSTIVTFTMYQDPRHAALIRRFLLLEVADYVHCMSYDAPSSRGHSTLEFAQQGIKMATSELGNDKTDGTLLSNEAAARKFTLGLPFYARHIQTGEAKTYSELAPQLSSRSVDTVGPYYFNAATTLRTKTRLARQAGLGGVMIWELGQDLQPLDSTKSLMWGVYEGATNKKWKELFANRRQLREERRDSSSSEL